MRIENTMNIKYIFKAILEDYGYAKEAIRQILQQAENELKKYFQDLYGNVNQIYNHKDLRTILIALFGLFLLVHLVEKFMHACTKYSLKLGYTILLSEENVDLALVSNTLNQVGMHPKVHDCICKLIADNMFVDKSVLVVDLSNLSLSDIDIKPLISFLRLHEFGENRVKLLLDGNKLTEISIPHVVTMASLQSNKLTRVAAEGSALEHLNLSNNQLVSITSLINPEFVLRERFRNLTYISLKDNPLSEVSKIILRTASQMLPSLMGSYNLSNIAEFSRQILMEHILALNATYINFLGNPFRETRESICRSSVPTEIQVMVYETLFDHRLNTQNFYARELDAIRNWGQDISFFDQDEVNSTGRKAIIHDIRSEGDKELWFRFLYKDHIRRSPQCTNRDLRECSRSPSPCCVNSLPDRISPI